MRILQVTPYFAPAWAYGGPPRVMYDYAVGLVRLGHEVRVLTTDVLDGDRRAGPRHELLGGAEVTRFANLSNSLAWRRKKYLPLALPAALAREVARYDVVHATDTRTFLTAAAQLGSGLRGVPFCLSAHGSRPPRRGCEGRSSACTTARSSGPCCAAPRCSWRRRSTKRRSTPRWGQRPTASASSRCR